jgi:hypothetical protein
MHQAGPTHIVDPHEGWVDPRAMQDHNRQESGPNPQTLHCKHHLSVAKPSGTCTCRLVRVRMQTGARAKVDVEMTSQHEGTFSLLGSLRCTLSRTINTLVLNEYTTLIQCPVEAKKSLRLFFHRAGWFVELFGPSVHCGLVPQRGPSASVLYLGPSVQRASAHHLWPSVQRASGLHLWPSVQSFDRASCHQC